jgi:lysyl-tRNA synthetase class 2
VSSDAETWRPTANRTALEHRATLLQRTRAFFAQWRVLEVDTPVVVNAAVTDIHIHSAEVRFPGEARTFYLHTSPEYAMKRLLAAGSGDIFQICHVVRGLERGKLHNAEFTMVEWYRVGFSLEQLMDEVAALVLELLGTRKRQETLTYREAFLRETGLDPFEASDADLSRVAQQAGFDPGASGTSRDELLDALMALRVGPNLGRDSLCFVHRYPASQAALARLDATDPRCALRFELYCEGVELANGFHELASHAEQSARFVEDRRERAARGLPAPASDEFLLAALAAGLPDCAGVALGFDRVAMLALAAPHIDAVMPFPIERA